MPRIIALKNLQKHITDKYGTSLIIVSQKNPTEPQIVYSSDIDIVDMINTAYKYKKYYLFRKAKDVVPNIVTQFLEFFIGKANKFTDRVLSTTKICWANILYEK